MLPVQIYNTTVKSIGGATDLNYTSPLLHTVEISGLTPGQQYFYTVGDGQNSSAVYNFTALQAPGALPLHPVTVAMHHLSSSRQSVFIIVMPRCLLITITQRWPLCGGVATRVRCVHSGTCN